MADFPGGVVPLESGVLYPRTVNPFTWTWYGLNVLIDETPNVTRHYSALVELDSVDTFPLGGQMTWASFDVTIVNETLPANAQTAEPGPVSSGSPECWFNELCTGGFYARYKEAPRVTSAFGYNASGIAGLVAPMRTVYIGVREAGMAPGTVSYNIRATAIPRELEDGMHIVSALPPCVTSATGIEQSEDETPFCRQYFTVDLADFDVLEVSLTRGGDNLTMLTPEGETTSTGEGFVGYMYTGAPEGLATPPPAQFSQRVAVTNTTTSARIGYFCTTAAQAGTYVVAIASDTSDAHGFAHEDWLPRQGRGMFNITVRHSAYRAGALDPSGDVRGGCVHYGQVRNFTVQTQGDGDTNLYVALAGGNASFLRARCDGCEWVEARHPLSAVSASPCNLRNTTRWQVQVGLDDYTTATLAGLAPAEFTMSTTLQNSTAPNGYRVAPASEGGDGYVCCGAIKSWLVPSVPLRLAPAVQMNVTAGHLRAVFIKVGECVNPTVDVVDAACTGDCEMAWLTVYDAFYGTAEYTQSLGSLAEPFQMPWGTSKWVEDPLLTQRRAGDYYIAVEGLPGVAAEFEMEFFTLDPGTAPYQFDCTRFSGFCPEEHYSAGYAGSEISTAAQRHGGGALFAAAVALVLSMALSCENCRLGRRHT